VWEEGKNSIGVPIYKTGAKESWTTTEKLAFLMLVINCIVKI